MGDGWKGLYKVVKGRHRIGSFIKRRNESMEIRVNNIDLLWYKTCSLIFKRKGYDNNRSKFKYY